MVVLVKWKSWNDVPRGDKGFRRQKMQNDQFNCPPGYWCWDKRLSFCMVLLSAGKDQAARSIHPSIQQFCLVCLFGLCYSPQSSLQKVSCFLSAMTEPLIYEFVKKKKKKACSQALSRWKRVQCPVASEPPGICPGARIPGLGRSRAGCAEGPRPVSTRDRAAGPGGTPQWGPGQTAMESLEYTALLRNFPAPACLKGSQFRFRVSCLMEPQVSLHFKVLTPLLIQYTGCTDKARKNGSKLFLYLYLAKIHIHMDCDLMLAAKIIHWRVGLYPQRKHFVMRWATS